MLIRSVAVARWNNDTEEPVILDAAYNLAEYSFFQRGRCARESGRVVAVGARVRARARLQRARAAEAARWRHGRGRGAAVVGSDATRGRIRAPVGWAATQRASARRQRSPVCCSVKEFLNFAIKTLMKRLTAGVQCVDYEGEGSTGVRAKPAGVTRARASAVHHPAPGPSVVHPALHARAHVAPAAPTAPRPPCRTSPPYVAPNPHPPPPTTPPPPPRRRCAGNMCFCLVGPEGLGAIAICDKEYPARVAVAMLKEQLAGFKGEMGTRWRGATDELACKYAPLEGALREYQEPAKVDKILKLDRQLTETKDILYKTIDAVLQRGEKLDDLVDKSAALSQQSKLFYKQAKKTNSCCSVM